MASTLSGTLELNLINGRLRLDSRDANYSYGQLQKVLETGLSHIWNPAWQRVLVLGLGGGCVVVSLRKKFGFRGIIDTVEADPVCLNLAKETFFILDNFQPLNVYLNRAEDFIFNTQLKWDCIIMDVFINNSVPATCLNTDFILKLIQCLNPIGTALINIILPEEKTSLELVLQQHGVPYKIFLTKKNYLFIVPSQA